MYGVPKAFEMPYRCLYDSRMPSSLDAFSQGCLLDVFTIVGPPQNPHRLIRRDPPASTPFRQATYLRPLKINVFLSPFWIDFWWIFLPNLAPKINQNRPKIDVKMPSHLDFIFGSIFN